MAKGEQKGNREAKKPKKEKIKTIAAAPSQKTAGWQPSFAAGKKKERPKPNSSDALPGRPFDRMAQQHVVLDACVEGPPQ
jgi:hypothetical protein